MMARVQLSQALAVASQAGRVCPRPGHWNRLYQLLPNIRRDGYGFIPPAPLILAAWSETSDEDKQYRLREHIEWAEKNGALETVCAFLEGLPESEWHHVGE